MMRWIWVMAMGLGLALPTVLLAQDQASEQTPTEQTTQNASPDDAGANPNAAEDSQSVEPEYLREWMHPELLREAMFGLKYWQWLGLFIAIVIGLMFDLAIRMFLRLVIYRVVAQQDAVAKRESILRAVRPFGLFASAVFWVALTELNLLLLDTDGLPLIILNGAAQVFAVLTGTWAAWQLTNLAAEVLMAKAVKTQTHLDNVLIPMLRRAVKLFILAFGVIYGAQVLDIPIAPLLASIGIGSLAFGLAAKDTIENFFGSVAVLVDQPFRVGDWVVIDNTEGTVEEIGFRSTRIRTFYNSLVTVPNATLVRAVVDNYGARKYRRWRTFIGIQYDTPPDRIVAFTEGIRELVRTHPYTRKDYFQVYLNDFADSALNILLYIFHEVPDWSTELRERERLFLDIIRLADQLGVQFAFPTTTVHLYKEEHKPHESAYDTPQQLTDRRAQVTGIRTAQQLVAKQSWVNEKPGPVTFSKGGPTFIAIDPVTGDPVNPKDKSQIENRTAGG